jgi:CHAT domain-containing protein/tetratricopeptide (TPR) repeat protein
LLIGAALALLVYGVCAPAPARRRVALVLPFVAHAAGANEPQPADARAAAEAAAREAERLRTELSAGADEAARAKYEEALRLWRELRDARQEAATLRQLGALAQAAGRRDDALQYFREALARAGHAGSEAARLHNDLCYLQADLGDYKAALAACARARALAGDDRRVAAQALSNNGYALYQMGELRRALADQQAALRLWTELRDDAGQAQSQLRLGYVYAILGEPRQALTAYQRALALYQTGAAYRGQALTLVALGHLDSMTGGKQEALDYYNQALALAERLPPDDDLKAQLYSGLGYVHFELGNFEQALDYDKRALALYEALPDRWGEAALHLAAGQVYGAMGAEPSALEHYEAGLSRAREIGNARLEASLLRETGALLERLDQPQSALSYYQKSLALSRTGDNPRSAANALNHIGRVYAAQGRAPDALACFARALPLARAIGDRFSESVTLYNTARVERDLGHNAAARKQIAAALELVESLRTDVFSRNLRTAYFATVRQFYDLYIDVLMRLDAEQPGQGHAASALAVSEQARARTLLETLNEARADIRQGIEPALLERERALRQELNAKAARQMQLLGGAHTSEEAADIAREIGALTDEYDAVEAQIRAASPHYAALTQPRPLALTEIQTRILAGDDALLLEYALGDERSYLWVVSRTELASYELPPRAEIETAARRFYELLTADERRAGEPVAEWRARTDRAAAELPAASAALGDMLLGKAAARLGDKRLLVVADGALQYVPFQALVVGASAQTESEAAPLFLRHEIVNEPSASALALLLDETAGRAPAPRAVAVLADPVFDADDGRARAPGTVRPVAAAEPASAWPPALRDAGFTGERLPRLVASREEAAAIVSVAPADATLAATDFAASRATATSGELAQYRVVHFATHGLLNNEHPELSGVVLSLVDREGRPQDGFLRLHDIYNLRLPVDLVVLSACQTGLGKEVRGEGLLGLTRGFMYAGAAGVVASLWKVDDEATAELMRHFYAALFQKGLPPAAALRAAQLALWQQRRWRAPYYWAGFVIQGEYAGRGDWRRVENKAQAGRVVTWGGAAAALSCAAFYFARRRRRKTGALKGAR